jgi:hypothetical protein
MPFKYVDVQSQLYGIVNFRAAVAVFICPFLGRCSFDVAGDVATRYLAQKIRHSQKIVGTEPAAVDERVATSDG